jgi:hypothetical protein
MDSKRVYILGAGSSIGHTKGQLPGASNFARKAEEIWGNDGRFKEFFEFRRNQVGDKLLNTDVELDIESLFTFLEIEIKRNNSAQLLMVREQLLKLIREVLFAKDKATEEKGNGEYYQFYKALDENDTIVTFNWDILLDDVLCRKSCLMSFSPLFKNEDHQHYWRFLYKLSGRSYLDWKGHLSFPELLRLRELSGGYYLKLHGSVDWFYCYNPDCKQFNNVYPKSDLKDRIFCDECREGMNTLIIPPTLNKTYSEYPFIRRIWNIAADEMKDAEEIVIWGYSLPPTDFHASWLLRQVQAARLRKLVLINPSVITHPDGKRKIDKNFVKRFYGMFSNKLEKNSLELFENFGDFVAGANVLKKHNLGNPEEAYHGIEALPNTND